MDADQSGADGFEFNLTRVLESLEQRGGSSLADLTALGAEQVVTTAEPEPLTITPVSDDPEPLAPLPHRVPSQRGNVGQQTRPAPRPARVIPPAAAPEPLPTRTTAAPEPLPTRTAAAPKPDLVPPGRRSMFDEAASGEARATLHRVPVDTNVAAAAQEAPLLPAPTLPQPTVAPAPSAPAVNPAASNVVMPTVADVRQFQSTQRRQARKNRQGRVLGRLMLVVILIVAAVAVALTVGRDYLFPADWADDLAPLAEQIEAERGIRFEEIVTLVEQPPAQYATTVVTAVLGPDPDARLAIWRALGVASGEIAPSALGERLAALHPAVYDAGSGSIVRMAGVGADLRPALEAALDHQLADAAPGPIGVLGPVPAAGVELATPDLSAGGLLTPPVGAIAAAEQVVADLSAAPPEVGQPGLFTSLALAYHQIAAAQIAPLVRDAGRTLPIEELMLAPDATLAPGDSPLAAPAQLSLDDWTLVWANRLPADSVATLTAATVTNSVRTFDRAGMLCVGALFETGNEMFAAALVNDLGRWAAGAPAEAQATVTQVAPTFVQLVACDPGGVPQALDQSAVDAVVARQLARLNAPVD